MYAVATTWHETTKSKITKNKGAGTNRIWTVDLANLTDVGAAPLIIETGWHAAKPL